MDLQDLTPAGGGSLRAALRPESSEPVATFTRTAVQHPDEIWSPRGSEIAPPQRPLPQPGTGSYARPERLAVDAPAGGDAPHIATGRMVRSAVRPG